MTIETQAALPAGWYDDPARSGGDRWWDGTGWTEYLRPPTAVVQAPAPIVPAPVSVPVSMPIAQAPIAQALIAQAPVAQVPTALAPIPPAATPAPLAPLAPLQVLSPATAPTALQPIGRQQLTFVPGNAVSSAPTAPNFDLHTGPVLMMRPDQAVSNGSALLALLFGAIAISLAITNVLPGNQLVVALISIVALCWAIRALVRRHSGAATNAWAPVIAILLSVIATGSIFFGGTVMSLVSSVVPQAPAAASTAAAASSAPVASAEPLVFPLNASLTAEETGAQGVATAINRMYASGNATLPEGDAWPASLRMSGSTLLAPNGARVATIPAGMSAKYTLSAGKHSYTVSVTGTDTAELATYSSGVNGFSVSCPPSDGTCTPSN